MVIILSKIRKDNTIVKEDGEKTENLHRDNIDSKEKEQSIEGIKDYKNASTDSEKIQAIDKRLRAVEKIIYGDNIHDVEK